MKIKNNSDDLEKALNSKEQTPQMSKEETIGFHKGALNTLVNERNELLRMIQIVDSLIQAHAKQLEALGIKLQK